VYAFAMNPARPNFKELPISERIQLVEDIWDSIAEETPSALQFSEEERAELHRRLAAHRADPSQSVPWEQVRSELLKDQG
jgi:putative addiction module component (TIGR02574 family)